MELLSEHGKVSLYKVFNGCGDETRQLRIHNVDAYISVIKNTDDDFDWIYELCLVDDDEYDTFRVYHVFEYKHVIERILCLINRKKESIQTAFDMAIEEYYLLQENL